MSVAVRPWRRAVGLADRQAGLLLSLPALVLLLLFVVLPFAVAVNTSLTNESVKTILDPSLRASVGAENYLAVLRDARFLQALRNTAYFVAVTVPLQVGLALALAVLVNGSALWQRALGTVFFLPVVTSLAVLSVVWSLLYNPSYGFLNALLRSAGLPAQPFLTSPDQAMPCIIAMSVWQGAGFQMMIFLAGMQAIPPDLYEVARIEGASRWQQFRLVTLPLLRNTTLFVVLTTTILAFKLFVQPHLLTGGGPEGATRTVLLYLYHEAFTAGSYGRASAVCVIFFVLVVLVCALQRRLLPREERR